MAVEATKAAQFKDWWWKVALGKCYALLGLIRDAEQQFRSALKQVPTVDAFLRLSSIYTKLDQPLNVLEVCTAALQFFPNEVTLQTEIARFGMYKYIILDYKQLIPNIIIPKFQNIRSSK